MTFGENDRLGQLQMTLHPLQSISKIDIGNEYINRLTSKIQVFLRCEKINPCFNLLEMAKCLSAIEKNSIIYSLLNHFAFSLSKLT